MANNLTFPPSSCMRELESIPSPPSNLERTTAMKRITRRSSSASGFLPVCLCLAMTVIAFLLCQPFFADVPVTVATYNIKYLSSENLDMGWVELHDVRQQGDRLEKLKKVINLLDADIIGLQEIRDREALELVFDADDWTLVIDDDNSNCQDLALAVRKPFEVKGAADGELDADDEHFLFEDAPDYAFPQIRDVLYAEVLLPNNAGSLYVMVHHALSRYSGRHETAPRRVAASKAIIKKLEQEFDERPYILLGDFNDNPDDASLNILETGSPDSPAQMENNQGQFLVNLTEILVQDDHVSHGLKSNAVNGNYINTFDPGSRQRNFDHRHDNSHTGDILFDQILVPHSVYSDYVLGSVAVFNRPCAVDGNDFNRASDHLPVYAEFVFASTESPSALSDLKISGLLPNPEGSDDDSEAVILLNQGSSPQSLDGWKLRDRANHVFELSGSIGANAEKEIVLPGRSMPLNNDGDTVELLNPDGLVVHQVSCEDEDVKKGIYVEF